MKHWFLLAATLAALPACLAPSPEPTFAPTIERHGEPPRALDRGIVVRLPGRVAVLTSAACDVFDIATRSWTASLPLSEEAVAAAPLADGRILAIAIGRHALIVDVDAATGVPLPRYPFADNPRLASLHDGRVLACGGLHIEGLSESSECGLFDPVSSRWSATSRMSVTRNSHTMTTLPSGEVLIVGGDSTGEEREYGDATSVAEVFDPSSESFRRVNELYPRAGHTATLLADGRVLVAGGIRIAQRENPIYSAPDVYSLDDAAIFDPESGRFDYVADLPSDRNGHAASMLAGGDVLLTPGHRANTFARFSVGENRWSSIPAGTARSYLGVVPLDDGDAV